MSSDVTITEKEIALRIGKTIKRLRKQYGYTQEQLANMCGWDARSSVNRIEQSKAGIPQEKLAKLAEAFHMTVGELLEEMGLDPHISSIRYIDNLPQQLKTITRPMLEELFSDDEYFLRAVKKCDGILASAKLADMSKENKELIRLAILAGLRQADIIK